MIYNFENLSFRVMNVVEFSHRDGRHAVKERPHAALSYKLNGDGSFQIDGKSINVKSGEVIFIPADMPYRVEYSCSKTIVLHLLDCNYREAEKITPTDSLAIESRFRHLLNVWQENRSVNRVKAAVFDILSLFETDCGSAKPSQDVLRCTEYLRENFTDPLLSVEALCLEEHTSHSTLQRKFKKDTGMTPKQYLTRLRMNKAIDLLSEGGSSVRSIAYECGYSDEKYFSRAFKQIYGCSPIHFKDL